MGLQDQLSGTHATKAHFVHGVEQGVAARHPLQALFKPGVAADALDVAMQHDCSVNPLGRPKAHGRALKSEPIIGMRRDREPLRSGRTPPSEACIALGLNQTLKDGEDSGQDGEMGHEP